MKPLEPEELKKRNEKYSKIIFESMTADKDKVQKQKEELKLNPTPREVIYSESSIKLYRFTPVKKNLKKTPVLMVPSLILKYYILDLMKGHSLIEHLVNNGYDTYLLDWGTPGDEHGHLTFDDYIDKFLKRAVNRVSRRTGSPKIHLFGQCIGGTLAAIFASLYPEKIEKLICLTTPVDFEDSGLLSSWTDRERFDVDKIADSFGNVIPADFIHAWFQYLDLKKTVDSYKNLYNNVLDENFMFYYQALDNWLKNKVPFPAGVFRKFIKDLYQENKLSRGEFEINGVKADLSNITCPVLNITAQFEHVFPEQSAKMLNDLVQGPVSYHVVQAGHVTLVAVFPQRLETFKLITDFLE